LNALSNDLDIVDTLLRFYLFEFLSEAAVMPSCLITLTACAPLVMIAVIPSSYLFLKVNVLVWCCALCDVV
jgi:hypothetical protein